VSMHSFHTDQGEHEHLCVKFLYLFKSAPCNLDMSLWVEAGYLHPTFTPFRWGCTLFRTNTHTHTHVDHIQRCAAPRGNQTAAGSANVGQLSTPNNEYGQIGGRGENHPPPPPPHTHTLKDTPRQKRLL